MIGCRGMDLQWSGSGSLALVKTYVMPRAYLTTQTNWAPFFLETNRVIFVEVAELDFDSRVDILPWLRFYLVLLAVLEDQGTERAAVRLGLAWIDHGSDWMSDVSVPRKEL